MRAEIEQAFDMHAVDIYGLSEVMGPGVANECVETKDGLHIWEDHFYPEIIDPEHRRAVLPDGEMGELVFTTLTKEGPADHPLPHPRPDAAPARHGALDAADGKDHRAQRRHDHPARRQRLPDPDRGADPEMRRPRPAFPDRADADGPDGRDDACIPRRPRGAASDEARKASAKELAHHIKSVIGVSARSTCTIPGGAPRSEGKAKRVVDNRPKADRSRPRRPRPSSKNWTPPSRGADDPACRPRSDCAQAGGHAVLDLSRRRRSAQGTAERTPALPGTTRAEIHAIERRIVRRFAEVLRQVPRPGDPAAC
jgi:hypothetical protein